MKILHIVEDFSIESGGLRTVVKDLNIHLNQNNFSSFILSSNKEKLDNIFLVKTQKPWLYSREWKMKVKDLNDKHRFDLFHIHGVWTYPQYVAAKFCIRNKIPFILSVHGMYEPWLWKKGALKKKLYFNILSKKLFEKANAIHAITPSEQNNLKKIFKEKKIIEIPNLIKDSLLSDSSLVNINEKYLLFIGRLDQIKGIDILIKSFSKINNPNFILKIAGKINDYKEELDVIIKDLKLSDKVKFLGLVSGKKKEDLIKKAFVLVAPSYSEVVGMVNLEGAILKTPVITTHQTGLNPLWNDNGGKLINPDEFELEKALREVYNWTNQERNKNGEKLYNFVVKNYSWEKRFKDWKNLYISCINEQ